MADAKDELKAKLKQDPAFRAELKERLKTALFAKIPAAQAVQYNFDSYMLQDIQVRAAAWRCAVLWLSSMPISCCCLQPGQLRILEVDERLVLPTNT